MESPKTVTLTRDVEGVVIPVGDKVTLIKGEEGRITQSLGGSYTIVLRGNMFRIDGKDADALGIVTETKPAAPHEPGAITPEALEKEMWDALRTCYDPEIPVNIVDLGLVYDCRVVPLDSTNFRADVKMTLTAPGCGMGPMIAQDVQNKLVSIENIQEANVELVWDPPWNQDMMSEAAKLQLGLL